MSLNSMSCLQDMCKCSFDFTVRFRFEPQGGSSTKEMFIPVNDQVEAEIMFPYESMACNYPIQLHYCNNDLMYFPPLEHLGARAVCSHVACNVDGVADLCSLRHLSCCLCGRSCGLPPGVVYQRDSQTSRG